MKALETLRKQSAKNKFFNVLNVIALAVGICCAGLIFLWAEDEKTFDHFHSNRSDIYIIKNHQTYDGNTFTFDATPGPLAESVKKSIPGISAAARSCWSINRLLGFGEKSFIEEGVYVDADYLKIFTVHWVGTKPSVIFPDNNTIYLSQSVAEKLFGSVQKAQGQILKVANQDFFTVGGIFKDLPENLSYRFTWLMPFTSYEAKNEWVTKWENNGIMTFLLVDPKANIADLNANLSNHLHSKQTESKARLEVYPMSRWRLYNQFSNGIEQPGRVRYIRLFGFVAWIILLIACINFMNLATARSEKTAKEIGVRKTLGALRIQIIKRLIGQSITVTFIAALIAVFLMYMVLPYFNGLVDKHLNLQLFNLKHLVLLLITCLGCGTVAGIYPAFYLSHFEPASVLKGVIHKSKAAGRFRKFLVVFQFAVSLILIVSTIIIFRQIRHVQQRDLGFSTDNVVYTPAYRPLRNNFTAIRNDIKKKHIADHCALSSSISFRSGSSTGGYQWKGKEESKDVMISMQYVSPEFFASNGIKIREGRDFKNDMVSDTTNIIVNETLAELIGNPSVIGMQLYQKDPKYNTRYTIVGVVKNHFFNNMYEKPQPMIYFGDTSNVQYLIFHLQKSESPLKQLEQLRQVIKSYNPAYPADIEFADESFNNLFKTEMLLGRLSAVFAGLVIVIACFGLFGLAAFTAERKKKEMGIRKVLGASVFTLTAEITKEFLLLVLIACLIAFPIAAMLMRNWLADFAYRIDIDWWIFIVTMMLGICICILTVGYQSLKVAVLSPVKTLRSE